MKLKKGDCFPNVKLFRLNDGSPEKISSADLFNKKKIVLVGVPGAFTPTCTNEHLPGYIKHFDSFKSKGIDDVYFISVNDPFVMQKWGDSVEKNDLKFLADSDGEFMSSSGLMTDLSAAGLGKRLSRFSMLVDNGLIKEILDENGPGLEKSTAEILLENI
ncbi:MAG: peroxiredoxin [Pseudomonadota bacterium]|nr:peroxiredoxin [Pseudomonadota bacterium]